MKKRLFYITAAIVVLVIGINLIARGEYFSGMVRDKVLEKAREELGYDVGLDSLVFNFFPAYIDVAGPYVKGWDPDRRDRAVRADRVRVYFSLAALIGREVRISRVQVNGAVMHVVRRPDGSFNTDEILEKLSEEKEVAAPETKVSVDEVVLLGTSVVYEDRANSLVVTADDAGADLRLLSKGYRLSCRIKDIIARQGKTPPVRMDVEGDVHYVDGVLDVGNARLVSRESRVTGSGRIVLADNPELDLKMDAGIDLGLLKTLALIEGPVSGRLKLVGVVKGVYPEFEGRGDVRLERAAYAGVELERVESGFRFEGGALSLDGIDGELYGGSLEGSAAVDFTGEEPRYTSNMRFSDILTGRYTEPDARLRFIPWYVASGVVNLDGASFELDALKAAGTLALVRYDLPHSSPEADVDIAAIKRFDADFALSQGTVRISSARAEAENTSVDFRGTVTVDGDTDLLLSGRSTDIEDISRMLGYPDMDGELDVTGTVTGSILDPVIKGKARISNASAGGIKFPTAFGEVELSGWRLMFSDFMIRPDQGSMTLNGGIYFKGENASFEEPYFDAALELDNVNARRITAIFYEDIPVNLTASGDIAFKGNTIDFEGQAHLVTGAGDAYGQKLDKGEVWAVLSEDDISFPKVIAVRDRDILTASGRIGFDGTFDARATSARVSLENFDMLMGTRVPVKGSVSVSVTGRGSFDAPVINARISAYTLYLKEVDLGEAVLDAVIEGGRLSGKGSLLGDKVRLDGFLELDSPYRWKGRLAFEQGRFEPFARMVYDKLPEDISFVSTGVLIAQGSMDNPENDSASLSFSDVTATILGRELKNHGDIRMAYTSRGLDVSSFDLRGEGVNLKAAGTASVDDGFRMNITAGFDLDGLRELLEDSVEFIDGRCEAQLKLRGPVDDPVVTGKVGVTGGGVKFRDFPQRFEDVSADLLLDGKVFELKSLKSKLGGGTVTATGRGGLRGFAFDNFSFTVTAQDVRVKYPEDLSSTVQAKLFVDGAEDKVSVAGDIVISKATYTERIEWKSWLVQFEKKRTEVPSGPPGAFDNVALNIHITGPQNIRIDNNAAKIPVTPDLYVRGVIGRPVLLGRLEATSGQVYFRNNAFRLSSAVVEFADPTRFNPIIDLQAETHVREYAIQLTLSGTLDRIIVSLLSDPPLEEADIITLLTLGRTTEGLVGHEAAITTGEAAGFVTGQIQDAVEERVRRLTGFDRFQIDPYLTTTGASSGPRLTVGKSLFSDKLYITYSSNLGTSEDQFVRLEYIINKNLSLSGERDELGRVGGDLKLRFNFK